MPMPWTYRHAGKEWARFLSDIREEMGTPSDNVAYTTAQGVFRAFRDRLTTPQIAQFSTLLPAIPRALFLEGWKPADPRPWADSATYLAEAQSLRRNHNLTNEDGLIAVAIALHRCVGTEPLRRTLTEIGPEALAFWQVEALDPAHLTPHGF